MASITIRNLDDGIKRRLRVRAAEHGRSMEEEAREILRQVVGETTPPNNLAAAIRSRFAALGGAELDIPARDAMRAPPRLPLEPPPVDLAHEAVRAHLLDAVLHAAEALRGLLGAQPLDEGARGLRERRLAPLGLGDDGREDLLARGGGLAHQPLIEPHGERRRRRRVRADRLRERILRRVRAHTRGDSLR